MSGDFSLTTFNSKGKLKQIENALTAVRNGETSVGLVFKDGVVLATEKQFKSPLVDTDSVDKIQPISDHVGATYSGLFGDFRVLLQHARKKTKEYNLVYQEQRLMGNIARETAKTFQEFTQSGGVRPFGISLLMAGADDSGTHLYQLDPSGVYQEWKATAVGKNGADCKSFFEKRFKDNMSLEEAVHLALLAVKRGFEGSFKSSNVEIALVQKVQMKAEEMEGLDQKEQMWQFRTLSHEEVEEYMSFIQE
jgi:20S proteasome subunit alpha 2